MEMKDILDISGRCSANKRECKEEMREGLGQEAVADVHGADEGE